MRTHPTFMYFVLDGCSSTPVFTFLSKIDLFCLAKARPCVNNGLTLLLLSLFTQSVLQCSLLPSVMDHQAQHSFCCSNFFSSSTQCRRLLLIPHFIDQPFSYYHFSYELFGSLCLGKKNLGVSTNIHLMLVQYIYISKKVRNTKY